MKLSSIKLFRNTPLTDYNNTIHFTSKNRRDEFFWEENHYDSIDYEVNNINFIRDKQSINLRLRIENTNGLNYMSIKNGFDDITYYAFIMQIDYINDRVCKIHYVIDVVMTYTQGSTLNNLKNVKIERQHLTREDYNTYMPILRTNDDVLKTKTKNYKVNKFKSFGDNYVMFQSAVTLTSDFGTIENPNIKTSHGSMYDNIAGATTIFICPYDRWTTNTLPKFQNYPWISQNFSNIQLIPEAFIDDDDLVEVNSQNDIGTLYTLQNNATSKSLDFSALDYSYNELMDILNSSDIEKYTHLVRNEYLTIELYDMNGNQLLLDASKIYKNTGLKLIGETICGYATEMKIYAQDYGRGGSSVTNTKHGAYLTQNMCINNFVTLPMLLNTGEIAQASSANSRAYAESQLLSNQASSIIDKDSSIGDRIFGAVNVASSLSPASILGKSNDEHQYYKRQQAEYKDLALQKPTITESNMGNAFNIANNINGIHLKFSAPSDVELRQLKRYYDTFGFELNFDNVSISGIHSMTIMNYLKIGGNYKINGIPNYLMQQLNAILESGVKFWHDNGTSNPMTQNILDNDFND